MKNLAFLRARHTPELARKRHFSFTAILFVMLLQRISPALPPWVSYYLLPILVLVCLWSLAYYALPLLKSGVQKLLYCILMLIAATAFLATYFQYQIQVIGSLLATTAAAVIMLNVILWSGKQG